MRDILFRGKRVDNGEWVESYYYKAKYYRADQELCDYITIPHPDEENRGSDHFIVIPETVGQYTGLTDKNGKNIFEGDILKCSDGLICIVEWDEENARFLGFSTIKKERYITYVGREPKSEVIGNIHDNPELLKGGEE